MTRQRQPKSIHQEEALGKVFEPQLVRRLATYLKPYSWLVALSIVLLLITAGLEQLSPYLTKVAIDDHMATGDFKGLVGIVLLFIALYVALGLLRVAQAMVTGWVGERVIYDLRQEIFAHIQKQSLRFHDRNPVGRLVTRVTSDVQTLSEIFSSGVVVVFGDLFTLIGIVIAMFLLEWRMALVSIAVVPLMIAATFFYRTRLREAFREVRLKTASLNAFLQEHLSGVRIVQLFSIEKKTSERFANANDELREGHLKTVRLFSIFFPILELISALALALIVLRGGYLSLNGVISIGMVVAFIQYTERFFHPIRDLAEKWNIFQSGMASAERVFNLLDSKPAITDPEEPVHRDHLEGRVEFRDVRFSYDGEEEVLHGVDFTIEPGETVAIVGATGAGKSTIINLAGRFYDVTGGQVLMDGVDVRDWKRDQLLHHIAYVPQDIFLFSGTIRENITLGADFSDESVREAAKTVHADHFIERLPGGYEEPVTERGSTLSSGQRQLLSFARAIVRDPALLILDEATSSVDPETESLIQDAMQRLMKGRTSIIVAHRLSTIQRADKILVMHKGLLRESGTHKELLQQKGLYWKLFQVQYKRAA